MLAFLLSQGACLAGSRLVRYAGGFFDVFLAVLAMAAALLVLPIAALRYGRQAQLLAEYAAPPEQRTGCTLGWLGPGEWRSTDRHATERWSVVFKATLPEKHWVLALDMALAGVIAINTAIGGGSCTSCGIMRIMDCVCGTFFCGVLLRSKPYARRVRVPISAAAQLMFACAAAVMSVSYFSQACENEEDPLPGEGLAVGFAMAGVALSFLALVLNAAATLWLNLHKRCPGRKTAPPEPDGKGAQKPVELVLCGPSADPAAAGQGADSMNASLVTPIVASRALSTFRCDTGDLPASPSSPATSPRHRHRSFRGGSMSKSAGPGRTPRRTRHNTADHLSHSLASLHPATPEGPRQRGRRRRELALQASRTADADLLSIIAPTSGLVRHQTGGSILSGGPSREPTSGSLLDRAPTATDGLLAVPQSSFHLRRRSPPSRDLRVAAAPSEDSPTARSRRPVRRRSQRGRDAGDPLSASAPLSKDAIGDLLRSSTAGIDWATMQPDV
eukprot:TRINITY_DN19096_c0_g1_i3.p1 TRINITY_DN19096_c0_g1~~TRINITY_DN19096_c0_g1_i3.p1  ORF type:complete len:502 (+),score=73.77 TRINITY_DN19096_c0_g1_i3:1721-3226(+)